MSEAGIRTFAVFKDLPIHVEYRVADMPLIPEGTQILFQTDLRYPRNPNKIRKVDGIYVVVKRKLIYSSGRLEVAGLTQYLDLEPLKK